VSHGGGGELLPYDVIGLSKVTGSKQVALQVALLPIP